MHEIGQLSKRAADSRQTTVAEDKAQATVIPAPEDVRGAFNLLMKEIKISVALTNVARTHLDVVLPANYRRFDAEELDIPDFHCNEDSAQASLAQALVYWTQVLGRVNTEMERILTSVAI